jgi:Flp pilus assembly protein TadD
LLLGTAYRELGRTEEAETEFRRALSISPELASVESNLGAVLMTEERMVEAVSHLNQAIVQDPGDVDAHYQLLRAYRALGKQPEAREEGAIVTRLKQEALVRARLAMLRREAKNLQQDGHIREAATKYAEAVQVAPRDAGLLFDLALVEDQLGNTTEERRVLVVAEEADPSLAAVHSQLGVMSMRSGDYKDAEKELKLALEREPQDPAAIGNLGVVYAATGRQVEAIHSFRKALDLDPDYQQAHRNLGILLAVSGSMGEAEGELEKALALDPSDEVAARVIAQIREQVTHHP